MMMNHIMFHKTNNKTKNGSVSVLLAKMAW